MHWRDSRRSNARLTPGLQDAAAQTVLQQAEALSAEWAEAWRFTLRTL